MVLIRVVYSNRKFIFMDVIAIGLWVGWWCVLAHSSLSGAWETECRTARSRGLHHRFHTATHILLPCGWRHLPSVSLPYEALHQPSSNQRIGNIQLSILANVSGCSTELSASDLIVPRLLSRPRAFCTTFCDAATSTSTPTKSNTPPGEATLLLGTISQQLGWTLGPSVTKR